MSRRLAAVLGLTVLAAPAHAQAPERRSVAELQALVARVEAQVADEQRQRSAVDAASADRRAARRVSSGHLEVVLWEAIPAASAAALVRRADSALAAGGVVTPGFLQARVFVMRRTTDTAAVLAATGTAGRRRVFFEASDAMDVGPDAYRRIADAVGREFLQTLDDTWRRWLPFGSELVRPRIDIISRGAREELVAPVYTVAERCLAGEASGCRLWLGLDADSAPFRSRYTAAELRSTIARGYGRSADVARCAQGDDEACVQVAGSRLNYSGVDEFPATVNARLSIVAGLRDLHGPEAMRRALADTTGSIGERLARASGVGLDELVLDWRRWLLAGGRAQHVQAGAGDLLAALAAIAVFLFLSTRSGRWT